MHSEFSFLEHLRNHFKLEKTGDDCAVFPKDSTHDYLITSDMLVENIDFRLEWSNPKFIGHKTLAVSVSDIAAMGGKPVYSMVSIGLPGKLWDSGFPDEFYTGYMALAGRFDVELIGGDISRTIEFATMDSTVIGEVPTGAAVFRRGAMPGDLIFVTGALGGAAAGLNLLERGFATDSGTGGNMVLRQLAPEPRDGSRFLNIATSMIDISDGLSSDLRHICDASGVGARLFADQIPVIDMHPSLDMSSSQLFEIALHGGEDFELLFTADPENLSKLNEFDVFQIGEITPEKGVMELIADGQSTQLEPRGFTHF